MAFDILNLEYTNTPQGEIQKYRDDMGKFTTLIFFFTLCNRFKLSVRVRAAARSVALVEKGDTRYVSRLCCVVMLVVNKVFCLQSPIQYY